MTRALFVILAAVTLDAVGMGLILPILPDLMRSLTGDAAVAQTYGLVAALYALMQFLGAPLLGRLSDRYGRRPVLLAALATAALDYAVMAVTPALWVLVLGRAVAGLAGASLAVCGALIADITPPDRRGQRFGWMHACIGLGLIVGPGLGGLLGALDLRAPFWAAAALNGLNALLAWWMLPEPPRAADTRPAESLNPFAPLAAALKPSPASPLLGIYLVIQMVGQIGAVLWVIYGHDRYGWDAATVGVSLTLLGLVHAAIQAAVTGPAIARLGERGALLLAIAIDTLSMVLLGLASQGWMAFALIPLLCLGALEAPALQALLSRATPDDRQGELQGLMTSLGALGGVLATLVFSSLYAATAPTAPGLVWIVGGALYLFCVPLLRVSRREA